MALVFGIVAELLRRDNGEKSQNHLKDVHDWIVTNYQQLMTAIEEKKEMKNKIETVKYLLVSVQSALEVFDEAQVQYVFLQPPPKNISCLGFLMSYRAQLSPKLKVIDCVFCL